jgi:hopanoid biosynthesis associated RND transporter like protein HpnN
MLAMRTVLHRWGQQWMTFLSRRAATIIAVEAAITLVLAVYAVTHLGVNGDNMRLLSPDLPFQRDAAAFQEHFPSLDEAILVVLDGETPEATRSAAEVLAGRLREMPERFSSVTMPGGEPFFERNGLLFLDVEDLEDLSDGLARMQPVIAELTRDGSIANLSRLVRMAVDESGNDSERLAPIFDQLSDATARVYGEYPIAVSWESLMLRNSAIDMAARQILVVWPVLELDALLPAGPAMASIREVVEGEKLDASRGVQVRITGNPALNHEEMWGIGIDVGVSGIVSFFLVALVLRMAFRSGRMVGAAAAALLTGLIWTAALAAALVGQLNLISIAFGVLFIGLGVDFSIHLGLHVLQEMRRGADPVSALLISTEEVGGSLLLCTLTTAIGFYAFVPTDYLGVAELGLISGSGMFVILILNLTLLPAMLLWRHPIETPPPRPEKNRAYRSPLESLDRHPAIVVVIAVLLGCLGVSLYPRAWFDSDVVAMRDPETESVQAFRDLLETSETSPWYADVLVGSLDEARAIKPRLAALDLVASVRTVDDFVPSDQAEKVEILIDAAYLLEAPTSSVEVRDPPALEAQIEALEDLRRLLDDPELRAEDGPLGSSVRRLRQELDDFLERLDEDVEPDVALRRLEEVLLGNLPAQIDRLSLALEAEEFELDDLPEGLRRQMLADSGEARIQILPREDLALEGAREAFVDEIRSVAPNATGVSVNLIEFGRATARSLREALTLALGAIAVLLFILTGRLRDVFLILTPLVVAGTWTFGFMAATGIPFNFANVIVLPLLLGIGVDSGVHLVHRAHAALEKGIPLLGTTTASAVFWSAITTITSFGSLAFSRHLGIASMGTVLVVGMLFTLAANLIVLPALLRVTHTMQSENEEPSTPS